MTVKNVSHVSQRILCPKCQTKNLRKSVGYMNKLGTEYFCDKDHIYFGLHELVYHWGYDLGDFGDVTLPDTENYLGYSFILDEPFWKSKQERDRDYEEVTEMFLGIPAWEDNETDYGYPY